MEFSEVYNAYSDDIRVTAMSQRIPGLDYDDVVSEMTGCLWKAWQTYVPHKGGFGSYWWSLWLNRRRDITRDAYAIKRPRTVMSDYVPEGHYLMNLFPNPPKGSTKQARMVWLLLAAGESVKDVMTYTGLSKRGYYDLIKSWRNEEVKTILSDQ